MKEKARPNRQRDSETDGEVDRDRQRQAEREREREYSPNREKTIRAGNIGYGIQMGNAIAGERQTRSLELLSYLPVDRRLDLLSRMTVAAGLTIALFAIHFLLMLPAVEWESTRLAHAMLDMFPAAASVIGIFGISWFFSIIWRSPVIPAVVGLGVIVMLLSLGMRFNGWSDLYSKTIYPIMVLSLGLGGLIFGSLWHLNRKVLQ